MAGCSNYSTKVGSVTTIKSSLNLTWISPKAIDYEILVNTLVKQCGWTQVTLPRFDSNRHAVDILHWIESNVTHRYDQNGSDFVFENPAEAVMFVLKWS